jgi:hypothetical protein
MQPQGSNASATALARPSGNWVSQASPLQIEVHSHPSGPHEVYCGQPVGPTPQGSGVPGQLQ